MDNLQAVIDAARDGQKPEGVVSMPGYVAMVHRKDQAVTHVDFSAHMATPPRKRGTVKVFDILSLNTIMAANTGGDIAVYIDPSATDPAIVAVLNGNGPSGPGHGDFRVSVVFRETVQWAKWKAIDGHYKGQEEFANFIEDNLADIAAPDAATVMEIVTRLDATKSVDFRSAIRLASGAIELTNVENIEAKVGAGKIAVPDVFELALSPFLGVDAFRIPARFRYRITNGKLTMALKLQRLEDVIAAVIRDYEAKIETPEGAVVVYGRAAQL